MDETGATDGALSVLAARWGLEHDEDNPMALVLTPQHLELRKRDEPKLGGIFVDFVGGAMAHRRKFGGGRGARCLNARSMAIVFHSFLSRMETPAERTPGGLCDTHG